MYKFFNCVYVFFCNQRSLLIILISIEMMMMFVLVMLYLYLLKMEGSMYFFMFFVVMMVIEGTLGLSLLIFMSRMVGKINLSSLNLVKW